MTFSVNPLLLYRPLEAGLTVEQPNRGNMVSYVYLALTLAYL